MLDEKGGRESEVGDLKINEAKIIRVLSIRDEVESLSRIDPRERSEAGWKMENGGWIICDLISGICEICGEKIEVASLLCSSQ